ncbi:MAG: alpha/beta hydrolase [Candidatus Rokuibacteriota bacterium]
MPFRLPRDARLVRFAASDGVGLEGRLRESARDRAVVLCHPHPLYGGSMLTPVILTVEQAFQEAGWTTLAFNFRGVGGSQGVHGQGEAEVADVAGALGVVTGSAGGAPRALAVAGYSFGSVVGGRVAASDPRVTLFLGVAPPLRLHDFAFLRAARCRVALIAGRRDEYAETGTLEALAASLPTPPWVRLLDADHFFTGALEALADACRAVAAG